MAAVAVLAAPVGVIEEVPAVRVALAAPVVTEGRAVPADLAGTDRLLPDRTWAALALVAGGIGLHPVRGPMAMAVAAVAACFL